MAIKKYRVTPKAAPFLRGGDFSFRVRFSQPQSGGGIKILSKDKCPILTVKQQGVVQTSNEVAQRMIENFKVPTITRRNNVGFEDGAIFEEYSGPLDADLNLDPIFESV